MIYFLNNYIQHCLTQLFWHIYLSFSPCELGMPEAVVTWSLLHWITNVHHATGYKEISQNWCIVQRLTVNALVRFACSGLSRESCILTKNCGGAFVFNLAAPVWPYSNFIELFFSMYNCSLCSVIQIPTHQPTLKLHGCLARTNVNTIGRCVKLLSRVGRRINCSLRSCVTGDCNC